jgi:6-phosphogluconate dehydrogenase (decarboxylating)
MQSVTVEHLPSGHSSARSPYRERHSTFEDEMNNLEQLVEVGTIILSQALDLLNNSLTSDDQLTVQSQYMPGSTIGMTRN